MLIGLKGAEPQQINSTERIMALADIMPPAPTLCSNTRSHLTVGKGEEEEQKKVCNSEFVWHGTREGVKWRKENNTHKKTQIQILAIYVMTDM